MLATSTAVAPHVLDKIPPGSTLLLLLPGTRFVLRDGRDGNAVSPGGGAGGGISTLSSVAVWGTLGGDKRLDGMRSESGTGSLQVCVRCT